MWRFGSHFLSYGAFDSKRPGRYTIHSKGFWWALGLFLTAPKRAHFCGNNTLLSYVFVLHQKPQHFGGEDVDWSRVKQKNCTAKILCVAYMFCCVKVCSGCA